MASTNSSGPIYSSPVCSSFFALVVNEARCDADRLDGSAEPRKLSFTTSFTVVEVDIFVYSGCDGVARMSISG